jgi:hypothetical protein
MHAEGRDVRADRAIRALDTLLAECQKFDPSGAHFFGAKSRNNAG